MDSFWRKRYQREAAAWATEGRLAMSVRPDHLLALLRAYRPPPPPSALEERIEALRREVLTVRGQLKEESARANRAHAEGYAVAVREQAEEVRRLRAQLATRATRTQSDRLSLP